MWSISSGPVNRATASSKVGGADSCQARWSEWRIPCRRCPFLSKHPRPLAKARAALSACPLETSQAPPARRCNNSPRPGTVRDAARGFVRLVPSAIPSSAFVVLAFAISDFDFGDPALVNPIHLQGAFRPRQSESNGGNLSRVIGGNIVGQVASAFVTTEIRSGKEKSANRHMNAAVRRGEAGERRIRRGNSECGLRNDHGKKRKF